MPIVVLGKTLCPVCEQALKDGQEIIAFPPLVSNENDPLHQINDVAFHADCFASHPLAERAERRLAEWEAKRSQGRICGICATSISDPDDYVGFMHFTDDRNHPLFELNYEEFHRSCLKRWGKLPLVVQELDRLQDSGMWKGVCLEKLLQKLRG